MNQIDKEHLNKIKRNILRSHKLTTKIVCKDHDIDFALLVTELMSDLQFAEEKVSLLLKKK